MDTPPIPLSVRAVGLLWVICGVVLVLGGASVLGVGMAAHIEIIVGVVVGATGVVVWAAKASSMLVPGIVSILLAPTSFIFFMGLYSVTHDRGLGPPDWIMAVSQMTTVILLLTGIGACVGNRNFKAWRASRGRRGA